VINSVQSTLVEVVVPVVVTVSEEVLEVDELLVLDVALLTVMIQIRYETSLERGKSVKGETGPASRRPGHLPVSRAA
jgi:hypothetical protein